ncbi:LOW QUALITY PROTEIN: Acyl-ACP_TE domain-containing protein [Cephalotus follicularis]|uniref:Acyl-[acyl-carrier-protein] hydrolase n=1 Tax=Cephalotus follicularis TaxID=3775 RepID=A0A1Q3DI78_CEPFO|nr:LOW QUALITY PROTEIN: Acyl-ACP_TE domain-containing protein [Cephalotus follicularis]
MKIFIHYFDNLMWVVNIMQIQVDQYPIWGEVVEIDPWIEASGKNGMWRDWLIRSPTTGQIFARETVTLVMMIVQTRRLSKMTEEARAEISQFFVEKQAIKEDVPEKIVIKSSKAKYVTSESLRINQLEVKFLVSSPTIPDLILSHQQASITLECTRECGISDTVKSLCQPDEEGILKDGMRQNNEINLLNGFSFASKIMKGNGIRGPLENEALGYTHLQIKGLHQNEEIVRGRTSWKQKTSNFPFST